MMMRIGSAILAAASLLVGSHATAGAQSGIPYDPPMVCVVHNGEIRDVQIEFNSSRGDSTIDGRLLREVFPAGPAYAAGASWYVKNEPVTAAGRRRVKYGLPRVLGATDVVKVLTYRGVDLFAEPSATPPYEVVYAPVNPFCEFQAYRIESTVGPVRG